MPMTPKLSELLEKVETKFSDDPDVQALAAEFESAYDEDADMDAEDDFADFAEEGEAEAAPADFDALADEDMAEDDEDLDFDMPRKKRKAPVA